MRNTGIALFAIAFLAYIWTVRTIWLLVDEANRLDSNRRFSRFWWTSAWKTHAAAFPASQLRRQIIVRFPITLGIGAAAMICIAFAEIHAAGLPTR